MLLVVIDDNDGDDENDDGCGSGCRTGDAGMVVMMVVVAVAVVNGVDGDGGGNTSQWYTASCSPLGAAEEFASPDRTFCADSYFGFRPTQVLPQ